MENDGLYKRVRGWATAPFSKELDFISFVLFTVLAVSVSYMWTRVLNSTFGDK